MLTDNVGNVMSAATQGTLFAGTSVASNNYFIGMQWFADFNKKAAGSADVDFQIKPVGGIWRSVDVGAISNGTNKLREGAPYFIIAPNTDIRIIAAGSGTGIDISAGFSGVFADIVS